MPSPHPPSADVLRRVGRDVESGLRSGEVRATPTLFIDGLVHRGGYDAAALLEALGGGGA
jgi:glutaredoxin